MKTERREKATTASRVEDTRPRQVVASGATHSGQSIRFKNDEYWEMRHAIGKYLERRMSKGMEDGKVAIWYMEMVEDAIDTEEPFCAMQ